jgi:glycine betaine transporter
MLGKFSNATDVLDAVQKLLILSSLALALLSIVFIFGLTIKLLQKRNSKT